MVVSGKPYSLKDMRSPLRMTVLDWNGMPGDSAALVDALWGGGEHPVRNFEEHVALVIEAGLLAVMRNVGVNVQGATFTWLDTGELLVPPDDDDEDNHPLDYVMGWLANLAHFRWAREQGDIELAIFLAFELGRVWDRLITRIALEDDAFRGRVVKEKASEGGRATFQQRFGTSHEDRDRLLVSEFARELACGTKRTAAYALVGERHDVSARTVARAVSAAQKS